MLRGSLPSVYVTSTAMDLPTLVLMAASLGLIARGFAVTYQSNEDGYYLQAFISGMLTLLCAAAAASRLLQPELAWVLLFGVMFALRMSVEIGFSVAFLLEPDQP